MPPATRERTTGVPVRWVPSVIALLFAVGWISAAMDFGFQPYDEGSLLVGAQGVLHGRQPVSGFWSAYPPGCYWLLAAAFRMFGEQVLVNRVMHAASLLGVAAVGAAAVFAVSRSRTWGLAGFISVVLYVGAVRTTPGYPPVLCSLLCIAALMIMFRSASQARAGAVFAGGLLTGIVAAIRQDVALYMILAAVAALTANILTSASRERFARRLVERVSIYALGVFLPVLVAYGILVAQAGADRTFDQLVEFPLWVYPHVRALPATWPTEYLALASKAPWTPSRVIYVLSRLVVYLPLLLAPAGILACLRLASTRRLDSRATSLLIGLNVLTLALFNLFRGRSDETHGWPLVVLGLVSSLALAGHLARHHRAAWKLAGYAVLVGWSLVLVPSMAYREARVLKARYWDATVPLHSRWAVGIRIPATQDQYNGMLDILGRRSGASTSDLFSGTVDHDRVVFNDVILYFLVGKTPPSYYALLDPGLVGTAEVQRTVIGELESQRVRTVVLLDYVSTEPNQSSVNKGVDILDTYISRHYTPLASLPPYAVLVRNDSPVNRP
jgi:hypothetical protein